ncbi:MAG: phosphoribosyltransferase family protein [Thermoprotei archaeon]
MANGRDKVASMRLRLSAVDYLISVKQRHRYAELEECTGLKPSVLTRYVKGRVIPTEKRAKWLIATLSEHFGLKALFMDYVYVDPAGMVDDTELIANPSVLRLAAAEAAVKFGDLRANRVVTMASDGIAYAAFVADTLGAKMVIAKKEREKGVKKFVSSEAPIGDSGLFLTAYAPASSIRKTDRCLIVDDLVRSGETQEALTNLVKQVGAELLGYSFLVAVTDKWKSKIEPDKPLHIVLSINFH